MGFKNYRINESPYTKNVPKHICSLLYVFLFFMSISFIQSILASYRHNHWHVHSNPYSVTFNVDVKRVSRSYGYSYLLAWATQQTFPRQRKAWFSQCTSSPDSRYQNSLKMVRRSNHFEIDWNRANRDNNCKVSYRLRRFWWSLEEFSEWLHRQR